MAIPPCPHCGRAHPAAALFCPVTGKPLTPPTVPAADVPAADVPADHTPAARDPALPPAPRARRWLWPVALVVVVLAGCAAAGAGAWLLLGEQLAALLPEAAGPAVWRTRTPRPDPAEATPTAASTATAASATSTATPTFRPTDTPSAPFLARTLYLQSPAMNGEDVRAAQERLMLLGYTEVGVLDGYYGAATEAAVRRFQVVNGLVADGVVGAETWARLFSPSAIAGLPLASPTPTAGALTGRIVFVSYRDGDEEIYIMNADGSGQTRLTQSQYGDTEPVLSPDGRSIVWVSQRGGGHRLYIMNADGSDPRPLTDGRSSEEYDPYFSPDGQWIAFSSSRGGRFEIWLVRPDGTGLTQLTSGPNGKNLPAWSPDGQWIAYNSLADGQDAIKVIRPNGTEDRVVLKLDEAYVSGWAGSRILFVAKNGATTDIYSMNPDGSDIRQLTSDPASDKGPFGTPDGRFIFFNSGRDGNDEIYVMRADGAGQSRLTSNTGNDYMATWGP